MIIKDIVKKGIIKLKVKNIESANLKAKLLLAHTIGKTKQYILVNDDKEISKEDEKKYFEGINKLIKGIPIQYITNTQEFMKMNFFVNKNVLIPRADTENLVEEVIEIAKRTNAKKILDMCTGSGAIAVSIAKYVKEAKVVAVDISQKALEVAKKNAIQNDVLEKIEFIKSDMFLELEKNEQYKLDKFDIIVSNPPYIKNEVIKTLDKEVLNEPYLALDGGIDGLDFYKTLIDTSYKYLKYEGYLCLEIGYDQKIDVIELIENKEQYTNIYSKKDLYLNDRIVITKVGD